MNITIGNRLALSLLASFALGAVACGEDDLSDSSFGVIDLAPYYGDGATTGNPTLGLPLLIEPKRAKGNGQTIEYYDFGLVKFTRQGGALVAQVNPMYFFFDRSGNPMLAQPKKDERLGHWWITGGNPTFEPNQDRDAKGFATDIPHSTRPRKVLRDRRRNSTAHQRPIIDALHDARTYSGLWEIVEVTAPSGYDPDSIKSWETLKEGVDRNEFKLNPTTVVINCPVLEERQEVIQPIANYHRATPRIEVWYRRKMGSCLLTNGWEALANPDRWVDAPADTQETGYWELRTTDTAKEGGPRPQTMDVRVFEEKQGQVSRRQITVRVGRFFTPMNEIKRDDKTLLEARSYNQLIADYDPTNFATFTPVLQQWDIAVPLIPEYNGKFTKEAEIDPTLLKERSGTFVRNLVVLGSVDAMPTCGTVKMTDAMGKETTTCDKQMALDDTTCTALGLVCNAATCKCDLPTSGFGEYCAPGVRRCKNANEISDDEKTNFAPIGYTCHAKKARVLGNAPRSEGGVCYVACNAENADLTDQKDGDIEFDSRCNYRFGETCELPKVDGKDVDKKTEAVCVRKCKSNDPPELLAKKCGTSELVELTDKGEIDLATGLSCLTVNSVTACHYNETLEPR